MFPVRRVVVPRLNGAAVSSGSLPVPRGYATPLTLWVGRWDALPAVSHQAVHVDDAIRRLPYLTVHVVELPDRLWVADPESLTCWVHRDAEPQQRGL
jgi:hypothetical protein